MEISSLKFPNGRLINEIQFKTSDIIKHDNEIYLSLIFEPINYLDFKLGNLVSVVNCYGDAIVNDVIFKQINCPTFFRVQSSIPEFLIKISCEKLEFIEKRRNNGDLDIRLDLNILFSLNNNNFYKQADLYDNKLTLYAKITKSKWIEELLPKCEYYETNEKYLVLENIKMSTQVMSGISRCRYLFSEGKYDEVLREGYRVLEALPEIIGYNDIKTMFEALKSSDDTYIRAKYQNLNSIYSGLKSLTHYSRHSQVKNREFIVDKIGRSDAKFFINSMELLINYILSDDFHNEFS